MYDLVNIFDKMRRIARRTGLRFPESLFQQTLGLFNLW